MFSEDDLNLASRVLDSCREKGMRIVTVESCTGGLLSALLTSIPGSSDVVERGFITYSNESKSDVVGVPPLTINTHGAVSAEVAKTMAQGALIHADGDISIAITGIAGPDGGTDEKPVGLVHFGSTKFSLEDPYHAEEVFKGDRQSVRLQACRKALTILLDVAELP